MTLRYEIDGKELRAAIKAAERRLSQSVPMALAQGADLVAAEARANHDYDDQSGALTQSIQSAGVEGTWDTKLNAEVAAGAAHGAPIEFGSEPHDIFPVHRQALRFPIEGGFMFAGGVEHPGNKAYNFLGNALEAKFDDVTGEVEAAMEIAFIQSGF